MIDARLAGFLQEGLGIHIGTRNQRLEPNGARATAVKVEADGEHLVVFISEVAAARVLPDLQANGEAAIVFARPTDDRACQVKARFISSYVTTQAERAFVTAQWKGFIANLERIGIPGSSVDKWVTWPSVAIRLKATALFEQTPGPDAGKSLA
jgi:hypothetical protein